MSVTIQTSEILGIVQILGLGWITARLAAVEKRLKRVEGEAVVIDTKGDGRKRLQERILSDEQEVKDLIHTILKSISSRRDISGGAGNEG